MGEQTEYPARTEQRFLLHPQSCVEKTVLAVSIYNSSRNRLIEDERVKTDVKETVEPFTQRLSKFLKDSDFIGQASHEGKEKDIEKDKETAEKLVKFLKETGLTMEQAAIAMLVLDDDLWGKVKTDTITLTDETFDKKREFFASSPITPGFQEKIIGHSEQGMLSVPAMVASYGEAVLKRINTGKVEDERTDIEEYRKRMKEKILDTEKPWADRKKAQELMRANKERKLKERERRVRDTQYVFLKAERLEAAPTDSAKEATERITEDEEKTGKPISEKDLALVEKYVKALAASKYHLGEEDIKTIEITSYAPYDDTTGELYPEEVKLALVNWGRDEEGKRTHFGYVFPTEEEERAFADLNAKTQANNQEKQ